MNATEMPNNSINPFHNHVRILPMASESNLSPTKSVTNDPPPCKDGRCDWPVCMSNSGEICLFNLPDDYYDYLRTHDSFNDHPESDGNDELLPI